MYYAIDPEAPEGEYSEFSEGPSEFEEVFELVPCEANPSENTNFLSEQGKPRCIYTYLFWSYYFMCPIIGYLLYVCTTSRSCLKPILVYDHALC